MIYEQQGLGLLHIHTFFPPLNEYPSPLPSLALLCSVRSQVVDLKPPIISECALTDATLRSVEYSGSNGRTTSGTWTGMRSQTRRCWPTPKRCSYFPLAESGPVSSGGTDTRNSAWCNSITICWTVHQYNYYNHKQ